MSKTIFEHIGNLTYKKVNPNTYIESDWKSYSPYMINKWLSMYKEYTYLIDQTQKYYSLSKDIHYKMLLGILPKKKVFTKYIKGKKVNKYNSDLIQFLATYFEISKDEVKDYMKLLEKPEIIRILNKYGYTDKEIRKMIK